MQRFIVTAVFLGILCCLVIVGGYFAVLQFSSQGLGPQQNQADNTSATDNESSVLRAVIVDALSVDYPNASFTTGVRETLESVGFRVDIFSGGEVTVGFLKSLAAGYRIVILRMHSAVAVNNEVYLFTNEPYSADKYVEERGFGLVREAFATDGGQGVFAVNWGFVKRLMAGKFTGSVVVAMGCESGVDQALAEEFLNQGAVGFVGWSGPVLLSHSDDAVLTLTRCLCVDKLSISAAVEKATTLIGSDPTSGAVLKYLVP
jgi:hypothetical protein